MKKFLLKMDIQIEEALRCKEKLNHQSKNKWQPLPSYIIQTEKKKVLIKNKSLEPSDLNIHYQPSETFAKKSNYKITIRLCSRENLMILETIEEKILNGNNDQEFVFNLNNKIIQPIHNYFIQIEAICKCLFKSKVKCDEIIPLQELKSEHSIRKELYTKNKKHSFIVILIRLN